jgi:hypothetical protein
MENYSDTFGNRTRDLPACGAVRHDLGINKLDELVTFEMLTCVLRATDLVAESVSRSHPQFAAAAVAHHKSHVKTLKQFHLQTS